MITPLKSSEEVRKRPMTLNSEENFAAERNPAARVGNHGANLDLMTLKPQALKSPALKSPGDEWATPVFGVLAVIVAGAASLFLVLYALCQPTISPNPGVAAYTPPPATRLVPLPRRSDAPELAELPPDPAPALSAMAQAQAGDQPVKREIHAPARKHTRVDPGSYDQRKLGYVQQWDFGYRGWSNNRAFSGGPRSFF
jgi:hypothetical protein